MPLVSPLRPHPKLAFHLDILPAGRQVELDLQGRHRRPTCHLQVAHFRHPIRQPRPTICLCHRQLEWPAPRTRRRHQITRPHLPPTVPLRPLTRPRHQTIRQPVRDTRQHHRPIRRRRPHIVQLLQAIHQRHQVTLLLRPRIHPRVPRTVRLRLHIRLLRHPTLQRLPVILQPLLPILPHRQIIRPLHLLIHPLHLAIRLALRTRRLLQAIHQLRPLMCPLLLQLIHPRPPLTRHHRQDILLVAEVPTLHRLLRISQAFRRHVIRRFRRHTLLRHHPIHHHHRSHIHRDRVLIRRPLPTLVGPVDRRVIIMAIPTLQHRPTHTRAGKAHLQVTLPLVRATFPRPRQHIRQPVHEIQATRRPLQHIPRLLHQPTPLPRPPTSHKIAGCFYGTFFAWKLTGYRKPKLSSDGEFSAAPCMPILLETFHIFL